MIMEKVLAAAIPVLGDRTVEELVIGISLIGVKLSDGSVGISYVLRDRLPNGCSMFPKMMSICGSPAVEIAKWCVTGENDIQRSVAAAVLSAGANVLDIPDDLPQEQSFGLDIHPDDMVGMVGYIRDVAQILDKKCKFIAFDKGKELCGQKDWLTPMDQQATLLPKCDIVVLSGSTTINGTIDELLKMCSNAREIIMVGPSTPMYAKGWEGTGVTALAGALWNNEEKEEIFLRITHGAGVQQIKEHMYRKLLPVK